MMSKCCQVWQARDIFSSLTSMISNTQFFVIRILSARIAHVMNMKRSVNAAHLRHRRYASHPTRPSEEVKKGESEHSPAEKPSTGCLLSSWSCRRSNTKLVFDAMTNLVAPVRYRPRVRLRSKCSESSVRSLSLYEAFKLRGDECANCCRVSVVDA